MAKSIAKANIGNALTSSAADHILGVAEDIFDETQQEYQSEINKKLLGASVWLTEQEYEELETQNKIDPNVEYNIY